MREQEDTRVISLSIVSWAGVRRLITSCGVHWSWVWCWWIWIWRRWIWVWGWRWSWVVIVVEWVLSATLSRNANEEIGEEESTQRQSLAKMHLHKNGEKTGLVEDETGAWFLVTKRPGRPFALIATVKDSAIRHNFGERLDD